jgi:ribonuclease P protein subunit RPR2
VPNRALHSRVSYLYQAAAYLSTKEQLVPTNQYTQSVELQDANTSSIGRVSTIASRDPKCLLQKSPRRLLSDLRSVSLKAQIRLSPSMKHSICKRCDTMLIDGSTCINVVENKSKEGRKPWADVLVQTCKNCGFERRFPTTAKRQPRRPYRSPETLHTTSS